MKHENIPNLPDIDRDGDSDMVDYAIMEEIEKEAKRRPSNNKQGCCLILLAPMAVLLATAGAYFII